MSMRMDVRLVSFWSLWAIIAQWRSRHLTKATRANREREVNHYQYYLFGSLYLYRFVVI